MSTTTTARARRRARVLERPPFRCFHAQVTRTEPVTPRMRRITVTAEGLRAFPQLGPDQWFRLFLPQPGQQRPVLPVAEDWWKEICAMPEDVRPILRNYTVRAARPEVDEIDVDFVQHGDEGPATRWAAAARPGDWIGMLGQTAPYQPAPDTDWQLIIGDDTALPAIGRIVEALPAGVRAHVYVEVADEQARQDLRSSGDVQVTWLPRGLAAEPGGLMLDALRGAELPATRPYAWIAGESGMVTAARRHLVSERGVPKDAIEFIGYWRHGAAAY